MHAPRSNRITTKGMIRIKNRHYIEYEPIETLIQCVLSTPTFLKPFEATEQRLKLLTLINFPIVTKKIQATLY